MADVDVERSPPAKADARVGEIVTSLGRNVSIWDILVFCICAVCTYVAVKTNDYNDFWYIGTLVFLYALALRVSILKLTCEQRLDMDDKHTIITWSSAFIAFLAIRGVWHGIKDTEYVRIIMEGTAAFLFIFVFIRALFKRI